MKDLRGVFSFPEGAQTFRRPKGKVRIRDKVQEDLEGEL